MRRINKKMVAIIALVAAFTALAFYVIWQNGRENQISNNGTESVQVVSGKADGFKGDINATVSYELGKIIDLKLVGLDETKEIGGAALEQLELEILDKGTTNGVDVVSGATYTSEGAFAAIADAMTKLKGR